MHKQARINKQQKRINKKRKHALYLMYVYTFTSYFASHMAM